VSGAKVQLTIAHAVEKVLFRIALREGGAVPLCRLFLELPFSLEEVEAAADKVADGVSVVKNEWGEFLTYEFPELMRQQPAAAPSTCPTCGGTSPPPPTDAGAEVRAPYVCDACYRGLRITGRAQPDQSALGKMKKLFNREDEAEDPAKVARLEHEIFFVGLQLGMDQFTHTMIAAQSRLTAAEIKTRLDKMAARRFVHVGLLPSGDAVGYRFPPNLSYPRVLWNRMSGASTEGSRTDGGGKIRGLQITAPAPAEDDKKGPIKIVVTPKGKRPGRPGGPRPFGR
jgi:hypothetical protein